ncbi:MAG: MBL fold metallo-hydrolase [Acidobacteriota bacterium]|nr:MAG: MBL fold metallo-hydrolase [Acidobacteriota bacterium]
MGRYGVTAVAAGLLSLSSGGLLLAQNPEEVEVRVTHVAGTVHMLEGAGGNVGVSAGPDGVLLVDDQFDWMADKIRAAIAKLGSDKPRFVLNTHWHGDHTGGNASFAANGTLIAHRRVRERLAEGLRRDSGRETPPAPPEALPVISFDESLTVHFNGETIVALHFPHSHTDGDSVIYFEQANVVHMGDLFFSGRFPFIDLESGGSVEGLIHAVESVLARIPADAKLIPGHGPLSKPSDLEAYHEMLISTSALVRQQIASGKSLEEIQQLGLGERWQSWSWQFIDEQRFIETLYRGLAGQPFPAGSYKQH